MNLQIVVDGKTRNIGSYFADEGVWRKNVRLNHLMNIAGSTPGWDVETYERLRREYEGFTWLHAINDETGVEYRARVADVEAYGFRKTYPPYGEQIFLMPQHWQISNSGQMALPL